MAAEARANVGDANFRINEAKYCSVCGKEIDSCECKDQSITISISLDKSLIRGITNLTNLIPKIQVSTNRCTKCGHTSERCTC